MRVGWGFDVHGFADEGAVLLAGVEVDSTRGVAATSDGDVVAHAVADALLGAAALGDLGVHFPSSDPQWVGADSMALVAAVVEMLAEIGMHPDSVDVTVVAQDVVVAPFRADIRANMSGVLRIPVDRVSVKATTTDGLGFIGRSEGLAAAVVAIVAETGASAQGG